MQLGFVVVRGASMHPTYLDGDVLLALYGARPRVGKAHLVVLPDGPDGPRPLSVKRITRSDEPATDGSPTWWVERDNPRIGVDSWLVGAIPHRDVKARVVGRIPRIVPHILRSCRTYVGGFRGVGAGR